MSCLPSPPNKVTYFYYCTLHSALCVVGFCLYILLPYQTQSNLSIRPYSSFACAAWLIMFVKSSSVKTAALLHNWLLGLSFSGWWANADMKRIHLSITFLHVFLWNLYALLRGFLHGWRKMIVFQSILLIGFLPSGRNTQKILTECYLQKKPFIHSTHVLWTSTVCQSLCWALGIHSDSQGRPKSPLSEKGRKKENKYTSFFSLAERKHLAYFSTDLISYFLPPKLSFS